jgi:hypothetical protein
MQDRPGTIALAREILVVSLAGLVLAIFMTWPLAAGLGSQGRTQSVDADGQYSIWNIAWVSRTLIADPRHLFDANIFYPHRTTLAYSEANLLPGALGVPVYWLTRNPWLTTNVVMLVAFASAFGCAYFFLRHLSGDRRAAAAGAILYAFCPYVFSHLSHIQLLFTGGIPLSMLMVHRVADEAEGGNAAASNRKMFWRGVALGAALAAQTLSCAYYGIFAGLMVGFATLAFAVTRGLFASKPYWIAIATGALTSLAVALPLLTPYVRVQAETGFGRTIADAARWSAAPRDYLVSSAHAHAWLFALVRRWGPWSGDALFPGFLAVALGFAGATIAVRNPTRLSRDRETVLLYGTLGVLALWASFGPAAGLYRVLYYLPTFSFLRAPSRMGLVVVMALAVFASIALRALFAALPAVRRNLAAAIVCAMAIADLTLVPIRWYRAPVLPSSYLTLAASPRAPVAEFPFYGERIAFPLHAQYMLFSTSHWMPLVNGYSDVIPRDFREAAAVLDSFPSDDAFRVLARHRVRYIAIHWDMFGGRQQEIRNRLEPYAPILRTLAADGRMTLYEVMRYP